MPLWQPSTTSSSTNNRINAQIPLRVTEAVFFCPKAGETNFFCFYSFLLLQLQQFLCLFHPMVEGVIFLNDKKLRQLALKKIYELAFGQSRDAIKLLYLSDEDIEALEGLDLRQVASMHRAANGGIEVKLVDKPRLIQMLLEATAGEQGGKNAGEGDGGRSFIEALNRAAESLRADDGEGNGG